MKKTTNMIEYELKGDVVSVNKEVILTQVTKKESVEEDTLILADFQQDIINFCTANTGKPIELKFSIKVVEK